MVTVFLASNPIAGMLTNLSVVGPYFIKAGIAASHLHRMNQIACTVFDSLPTSVGIIMAHKISGVKLKDGYPPLLVTTIAIPLIQMCLLTAMFAINV